MKQEVFEQRYQKIWQQLEQSLRAEADHVTAGRSDSTQIPYLYRQACHHLALARQRQYSSALVDRLNRVVMDGHQLLYRARPALLYRGLRFLLAGFPRLVRSEARLFWWSTLLLYGPAVALFAAIQWWPDMAYTVLSAEQAGAFEEMYAEDRKRLGRDSEDDFLMFGVYIWNNIRIAFQVFATGILLGLGTVFFLVFNGVYFGAVAGHLTQAGLVHTFYGFVIGHGSFELTAFVIAGIAGFKLGGALLSPGRWSRLQALQRASRISVRLIYGVIAMLVAAAFIEAFWSSIASLSYGIKYFVGALLWLLVAAYLIFAGRARAA